MVFYLFLVVREWAVPSCTQDLVLTPWLLLEELRGPKGCFGCDPGQSSSPA